MKLAVVDDFEADRRRIIDCIERYWKEENIAHTLELRWFESGEDFLSSFTADAFDLILLDCCMGGISGVETAFKLRQTDRHAVLIFVTTSTDYAIDGYKVAASDYLVKPFSYEDFVHTMHIALDRREGRRDYLTLPTVPQETKVFLEDIVYCDIDGHYTQMHLRDGTTLRMRMTFSRLHELLAPYPHFLDSYRGCLLNMARIQQVEELNFLMDSGARVPFRKKEHKKLLQQYSEYLFEKVRMGSK